MDKENLNKLTVEQKLFLWKQYDDHINKLDSSLVNVSTIVSVVLAIMASLSIDSNILFYSIPIAAIFFLYYIAYQQRVTEILRGFLCYIEEDILTYTGAKEISWSTYGVIKNYNVKYFRAQKLCGALFTCYIAPLVMYVFYMMYIDENVSKLILAIYIISFLFFGISFVLDIIDNAKIHKIVSDGLKKDQCEFIEKYYKK